MDPRLLRYFEDELRYIRGMGAEFAKEFPNLAPRLGFPPKGAGETPAECRDPYVERLLEAFAFLSARVRLKLDGEFPRFTQHLLEMVYPHYLAPTPSMAIVQLTPKLTEGALASGPRVQRHTTLRSKLGPNEQTRCEYRTAHDVRLWPLEIAEVEYSTLLTGLRQLRIAPAQRARAMLRIRLRATAGLTFDKLELTELPIWIAGGDKIAMQLYEQLNSACAIVARPVSSPPPWHEVIDDEGCVRPLGFEDHEALLPATARSFQGYRLLQEYFAFPARFMFMELGGLGPALRRCGDREIELLVLLKNADPSLEGVVDAARVLLFCAPVINLFPREAARVPLSDQQNEFHVVPDRNRPIDLEIHSITKVIGQGARPDTEREFLPLYATREPGDLDARASFYTVRREPRMLSSSQRQRARQADYVGSEVYLSLVDRNEASHATDLKQLAVTALCTNRHLPLHMPDGQDFAIQTGAPIERARSVTGTPTPPRASTAHGDTTWRFINHLALNYLSLCDSEHARGAGLQELLMLYADLGNEVARKQVSGLRSVRSQPVVRPLPLPGRLSFGRGVEVTIDFDEDAFRGTGVFLLGAVLARFFAKYVSINSFSETVLRSSQREEIMRWPAMSGRRPLL